MNFNEMSKEEIAEAIDNMNIEEVGELLNSLDFCVDLMALTGNKEVILVREGRKAEKKLSNVMEKCFKREFINDKEKIQKLTSLFTQITKLLDDVINED